MRATAAWVPFARLPWFALSAAATGGLFAVIYLRFGLGRLRRALREPEVRVGR